MRAPLTTVTDLGIAKFGHGGRLHSMDVSLTPELEKLLSEKVKSGLYQSPSEMIREGLRLLEERDRLYQVRLADLRREIKKGIESGPSVPGSQVFRELRAKAGRQRPKRP
jgi:antitoxin ParD1/3/4